MFNIKHLKNPENKKDYIIIYSSINKVFAKINLSEGASLQELRLDGHQLIKNKTSLKNYKPYASSILFPFANRVKEGKYKFGNKEYQLDINEQQLNNAIHGLVYNKPFSLVTKKITKNFVNIQLKYQKNIESNGFPYTFSVLVEYVFSKSSLHLNVKVENTDTKTFPFTIGWHPYFLSSDLYKSQVHFDCTEKIKLDKQNITIGKCMYDNKDSSKIKDQRLDDCFILKSKEVIFKTPSYEFELTTTEEDCFLQLYTPPIKNTIAIEPITGVSDSLNNGIGLKTLNPNETYTIGWTLNLRN